MPIWILLLVGFLLCVAVLLFRTLTFSKKLEAAPPRAEAKFDGTKIGAHLSELIRCRTVSSNEQTAAHHHQFSDIHRILENAYPNIHRCLRRELVNEFSLLYTWQGSQPQLPAILMAAHLDVVPADESLDSGWTYPPFDGVIDGEFVWGRGALDIKNQVTTLLESVEHLIDTGFQPVRTIYLAFGHDEEIGGFNGAAKIVELLKERNIQLAVVLDEGGAIYQKMLPGVASPVALVGVAEKGYLSLEIISQAVPGHSSMPSSQTTIGILARALVNLEKKPMPAHPEAIMPLFKAVGTAAPFLLRFIFANLWLFGGLVQHILQRQQATNAAMRTTTALTMVSGGVKDNVLPDKARAVANFRILPGDTIETVMAWAHKSTHDPHLSIRRFEDSGWEASPVSPVDSHAFHLLERTVQQLFGCLPVAPFLMLGATDARHYTALCDRVYRFSPLFMAPADMARVHGINERISIEALEKMVQFYTQLLRSWSENEIL